MRLIKIGILTIIVFVSLAACGIFEDTEPIVVEPVVLVDTSVVSATGVLAPETFAYLSPALPGVVDEVRVEKGQIVAAGEALIVLGGLNQAEAGLAAAEMELEAARQALDELNETSDVARTNAWLVLLDAKTRYNAAEEVWDGLDKDDYQDDIDDALEDVQEAEEDLEGAQETFDRYVELEQDNALRKRYEDDLIEAREDFNEKARIHSELIIELERTEAEWQAALAAVEQAQQDFDALISGPDPDKLTLAEARLRTAEAQAAAAQKQVEDHTLRAPFSGTIADLNIRQGEYAGPSQPVLMLADLGSLRVETTDLNEIDVVQIAVGDEAVVTFDAFPGQEFVARVVDISPKASEGLGVNYTVVIELDDIPETARWGMTAFVDIEVGE